MRTCDKCQAQNPDDAEFCASCGNNLLQAGVPPGGAVPPPTTPYVQPTPPRPPQAPIPGAPYQQQMPVQVVAKATNSKATASLVLGIIGIFICPIICSVIAIILGYQAKSEIVMTGGFQQGEGNAMAGIILGFVGLGIWCITTIVWVIVAVASSAALIIPLMI